MYNRALTSKSAVSLEKFRAVFLCMVVAAALLRLGGLFNDFWLDEIWGWTIARDAASWLDPLLKFHVDTNHVLNTFWMYGVGDRLWWPVYRLPSLFAGIATVILAGVLASEDGVRESLVAVFLTSLSFVLILYSTEARGYAFVAFFTLGAAYAMKHYLDDGDPRALSAMTACVALGFLAHLTFFHCYAALAAWSFYRLVLRDRSWTQGLTRWIGCHAGSAIFLVAYYFLLVRPMTHGGGPPTPAADVPSTILSAFFGAPNSPLWAVPLGLAALAVVGYELLELYRGGSDEWVLYGTAILVSPAVLLAANPIGTLFPRYFIVSFLFFVLIFSRFLVRTVLAAGAKGRIAFAAILAVYALGNARSLIGFYRHGRGEYLDALRYMAAQTPDHPITVGSEHDFANSMILRFYSRYLPSDEQVRYYEPGQWTRSEPRWVILQRLSHSYVPERELVAKNGSHYLFDREFPYSDLAGWNWYLYRLKVGT